MTTIATHQVYENAPPDSTRRFSVSSFFSARSESSRTQLNSTDHLRAIRLAEIQAQRRYFQPDASILSLAAEDDMIEVPIHELHLPRRKRSHVLNRINDRMMGGVGPNEEFKILYMSKAEYTRYWARDERGVYVGTEPEGMGIVRLKAMGW